MKTRILGGLAAVLLMAPGFAGADEFKKCMLLSAGSTPTNYEQIGPKACMEFCKSSDNCVAWTYQPHNFNPKNAPGACRLLPDVSKEEESAKTYCGRIDG